MFLTAYPWLQLIVHCIYSPLCAKEGEVIFEIVGDGVAGVPISFNTPLSRTVQQGTGPIFGVTELLRCIQIDKEGAGCLLISLDISCFNHRFIVLLLLFTALLSICLGKSFFSKL